MLPNNICKDVTQTSVTNMLQQQHVPVAPATTTSLHHPVTCTLSIHRVVQNGSLAMPAWYKDACWLRGELAQRSRPRRALLLWAPPLVRRRRAWLYRTFVRRRSLWRCRARARRPQRQHSRLPRHAGAGSSGQAHGVPLQLRVACAAQPVACWRSQPALRCARPLRLQRVPRHWSDRRARSSRQ